MKKYIGNLLFFRLLVVSLVTIDNVDEIHNAKNKNTKFVREHDF